MKAIKATKRGKRPTDQAAVQWLLQKAKKPSNIAILQAFQAVKRTKVLVQFIDSLVEFVHQGRLYSSFGVDTDTGRLASRHPNMQNIPASDPFGIRACFAAPDGKKLIVADYTALELYIMAHWVKQVTGDTKLYDDLQSGDVYSSVAKNIWPGPLEGVEPHLIKHHDDPSIRNLRASAKAIVLGTNYGKTEHGLAVQLGISTEDAKRYIDDYFNAYQGIRAFSDWAIETLRRNERIPTLIGRYRELPEIASADEWVRRKAERQAVNSIIQGSAADVVYDAMVRCEKTTLPIVLQVHDELIVEESSLCDPSCLKEAMEGALADLLSVKLHTDIKVVDNWGSAK